MIPGQTYQVVQTPIGTTNPNNYVTTYECRALDGTLISSGNGSPGTVTIPTGTDGASITCTFRNDLPVPSIDLTKTVSPTSFSLPGTVLTYTFAIRNTGNTVLNNLTVADTMPGLSGITCSPALGGTLQPNGTATCSATYTVTATDVLAASPKVNNATAGGTPPTGQGVTVTDGGTATATFVATPPTAVNDSGAAAFNQNVTVAGSTNDAPGNGTIIHALTVFTAPGATNGGKTLTTAQGTWNIQPNGTAVFTPVPGYVGTTPPRSTASRTATARRPPRT
ncbi:DUF7507 domain-containing protein [Serinibacter arcticus]|uniref:DUF7507 domain-containing protein n=1 Tax=Serinibacter arcticus TaxID=1655435 RepID=UPI0011B27678|nr:hypothetical protein [Serinibacter arcticus]